MCHGFNDDGYWGDDRPRHVLSDKYVVACVESHKGVKRRGKRRGQVGDKTVAAPTRMNSFDQRMKLMPT
jgi:hypothetical protein